MLFRKSILTKPLAILTGIIFLNLSFIMAEVNVFELEKNNHALYDILVSLISVSGEEEKDASGENSNELIKEFSPYLHINSKVTLPNTIAEFSNSHFYSSIIWQNALREIYSPPPES